MSRYIDAERVPKDSFFEGLTDKEKSKVLSWFLQAPTADVEEVRHGESISEMHYSDEFVCSECGLIMRDCCRYEIDEDADGDESCYEFEFRYCPRCGVKMDGGM